MMRFADPWLLLALVPVLAFSLWRALGHGRSRVLFSRVDLVQRLPKSLLGRARPLLPWLEGLGLVLLVVALAQPQSGRVVASIDTEGVVIELVIDRSDSMKQEDLDDDRGDLLRKTRLDVVKEVVADFIGSGEGELPGRPNDAIGLSSFCGFAQTHCPPTLDHAGLMSVVRDLEIFRAPRRNRVQAGDEQMYLTALGDGLMLAVDRLAELEARSKVVVLLSDGGNNTGVSDPLTAARAAAAKGIRVHTIGIGTRWRGLDVETLEKVAAESGGEAFTARSGADLREIYAAIDELERSEIQVTGATRWRSLHLPFLVLGLGLIAFARGLHVTLFRSLP